MQNIKDKNEVIVSDNFELSEEELELIEDENIGLYRLLSIFIGILWLFSLIVL
jgi:hypothetical protein